MSGTGGQRQRAADRLTVADEGRQRVLALAADFPAAWSSSSTPQRERKRMLALLLEDVTLIKGQQLTAAIRFRGGATTTLTLPRPLTAQQQRVTHDDVRQEMDALLNEYTDAQVAHHLNERGLRTGAGEAFDTDSVKWVRFAKKLKSLKHRTLDVGWQTSAQTVARLGVCRATLGKVRRQGRLQGASATSWGSGSTGPTRACRHTQAPRQRRRHPTCATLPLRELQYETRSFGVDVLKCSLCLGPMRLIACIEEPDVAKKILEHLGLRPEPLPTLRAQAPPVALELFPEA